MRVHVSQQHVKICRRIRNVKHHSILCFALPEHTLVSQFTVNPCDKVINDRDQNARLDICLNNTEEHTHGYFWILLDTFGYF